MSPQSSPKVYELEGLISLKKVVLEHYQKSYLLDICVLMHIFLNVISLSSPHVSLTITSSKLPKSPSKSDLLSKFQLSILSSSFVNWTIRFWTTNMPSPSHRVLVRFSGLVRPPIKILSFFQYLHFCIISSVYLDLCDHVKILRCINRKWIVDKEGSSWIISLYDLEQTYILSILGRSSSNKDLLK
jgi:hypothetical protein